MRIIKDLFLLIVIFFVITCNQNYKKNIITVSILPQRYFVKRITGDKFIINVMVKPGSSPATYEPLPSQINKLTNSIVYFRIGVPFEDHWIERFTAVNKKMKIVDTRQGIKLREFDAFYNNSNKHSHEHDHGAFDPHIWLSPDLVKKQANTIYNEIIAIDPENKEFYKENLDKFLSDLDKLSGSIEEALRDIKNRKILVFHPSWGYFADQFNLKQIPIEFEGKEPGPKRLKEIILFIKNENIKVIFVQKQFSDKSAKAIAKEVNCNIISIDPLSEDYINNLLNIAGIIKNSTQQKLK